MSNESIVYVRNTVSGVTIPCTLEEAAHILSHDLFKKHHEVVDSPKNEVLSQPYELDEEGERQPLVEKKDSKEKSS